MIELQRYYPVVTTIRPLIAVLAGLLILPAATRAQQADSIWTVEMREVVISATRTLRALEDVPLPLRVLSAETARREGAVRLADMLDELASARVVRNQFGAGVQLRGLDPAYTLILIDGEPVVGRSGGSVDVERLSLLDIERVEIVKGPSSSLYGSEALAGVVNIITREPDGSSLALTSQVETHSTTNLAATGTVTHGRLTGSLTADRYASGGYDLYPETPGVTSPRFTDWSLGGQLKYRSERGDDFRFRVRRSDVSNAMEFANAESFGDREDFEMAGKGEWRLTPDTRLTTSAFVSQASNRNDLSDPAAPGNDLSTNLQISYGKAEALLTWLRGPKSFMTFGAGSIREASKGERIAGGVRETWAAFGFGQHEWLPGSAVQVTSSARADYHTEYGLKISPKVAALWKKGSWRVRGAVGTGFKAPTAQQRYMDFVNPGSGYAVVGATDSDPFLEALDAAGQLAYRSQDWAAADLKPERAVTSDVGVSRSVGVRWDIGLGAFATVIEDMIETQPIGAKTNGQTLFSYVNLTRVSIRGVDASRRAWRPTGAIIGEGRVPVPSVARPGRPGAN